MGRQLRGADDPPGVEISLQNAAEMHIVYSSVQGGKGAITNSNSTLDWDSQSNLEEDPEFCDTENADYHIGNPNLVDVGNNLLSQVSDTDYDGNDRIQDGPASPGEIVDLGAYEAPSGSTLCAQTSGIALYCDCVYADIVTEIPVAGTVDARRPHPSGDSSLEAREGIGNPNDATDGPEPIVVYLEDSEVDVSNADSLACWSLCETDIEVVESPTPALESNRIIDVRETGTAGEYELLLSRPISAGEWTTITYGGSGDQISYASLPGDSGGDRTANSTDVLDHIDCCVNDICTPAHGDYSCDIDHSGAWNSADTLELLDLLNGVGTWIPWNNVTLPTTTTCEEEAAMSTGTLSADPVRSSVSERFVAFVVEYTPTERMNAESFIAAATAIAELSTKDLTEAERDELVSWLGVQVEFLRPVLCRTSYHRHHAAII